MIARFLAVFLFASWLQFSESNAFEIQLERQTIIVSNGTESRIGFFLTARKTLNKTLTILVQHSSNNLTFNTKCRIQQSGEDRCKTEKGPCECLEGNSVTFKYRLRMIFGPGDAGQWLFHTVGHQKVLLHIMVVCFPQMSFPSTQLSLTGLRKGLTFGLISYAQNITKCVVNQFRPQSATNKEVACEVNGSAPTYSLTLNSFDASKSWIGEENWTLSVQSELGEANITFKLIDDSAEINTSLDSTDPPRQTDTENTLLTVSWCIVGAAVFSTTFFLISIVKLLKQRGRGANQSYFSAFVCAKVSDNAVEMCALRDGDDEETSRHFGCRSSNTEVTLPNLQEITTCLTAAASVYFTVYKS